MQEGVAFALFWPVFYRALVVGIIAFWLGMMVLLVRLEWFSPESESLSVPTAYLWKLMFLHEESSNLVLYNQRQRLGNLNIEPHRKSSAPGTPDDAGHFLNAMGVFSADLPWLGRQNVVLHGRMELDARNEVHQLHLSAVFHAPGQLTSGMTVVLDGTPVTGVWHYSVQRGDEMLSEDTGTVSHLLDRPELRALGIDPTALARIQQQQAANFSVTARHGKLLMNRDEIETYVVSLKDPNGLETTIHLNQLGQILAVRTFAGVELLDGALNP